MPICNKPRSKRGHSAYISYVIFQQCSISFYSTHSRIACNEWISVIKYVFFHFYSYIYFLNVHTRIKFAWLRVFGVPCIQNLLFLLFCWSNTHTWNIFEYNVLVLMVLHFKSLTLSMTLLIVDDYDDDDGCWLALSAHSSRAIYKPFSMHPTHAMLSVCICVCECFKWILINCWQANLFFCAFVDGTLRWKHNNIIKYYFYSMLST